MTWSTHDPWEHPGLSVDTATDARRGVEGRPSLEQTVKRATVTHCLGFNAASGRAWINVEVFVEQFASLLHLSGSLCLIHESHHWNRLPARTMNVKPVNINLYLISCFYFTFIPTNILLLVLIALFL